MYREVLAAEDMKAQALECIYFTIFGMERGR